MKQNEREARERLRAFWAGSSIDRPALRVVVNNHDFIEKPWQGTGNRKTYDLDPEYNTLLFENTIGKYTYLAEAMPGFTLRWGSWLVTLAVFSGGDYEYDEKTDTAWITPIDDLYATPLPEFHPRHPTAHLLKKMYARLAKGASGRAYLNPPVMLDAMTTLSMFRTPDQLCLDLIEQPEDVKRWCDRMTGMYIAIYDEFYRYLRSLGHGDTSSWLGVMAEGKMEAVQCDFATMLSPNMFREFVLPDLIRVTDYMDYSLYHLDGVEQLRFLDLLRQCSTLNGIQWNPQPGAGGPLEWIDAFKEIRQRGFALFIWCSVDEAIELCRVLGPDGLFLSLPEFDSEDEASQAIQDITAVC